MQKIVSILIVVLLFTACKQKAEETTSSAEMAIDSIETAIDTIEEPTPPLSRKISPATVTDEVVGKDGKTIAFTYDNNASTVSFELNGKQVVLTSKEKISDMPTEMAELTLMAN